MRDAWEGTETLAVAVGSMLRFAERTGLDSERAPKRYLWTDAFAVCNFLGLWQSTGDERFRDLALRLIDQVHHTLGKHREDDALGGWLGNASAEHPTLGGLRIGKDLPERAPGARFDERLEWDRDGQYFHYLVKWMHALKRAADATHEVKLELWARELAHVAHDAFSYTARGGARRMYWKMSIDLGRPLVASMGQHDALDGYVTYSELGPGLEQETADFSGMLDGGNWTTTDPLGIGGLLVDAYLLSKLRPDDPLIDRMLDAALPGLELAERSLRGPAEERLAFRELGLSIGLHAVERMAAARRLPGEARFRLARLARYAALADPIESFWMETEQQESESFREHLDIDEVMLATSLAPDGFLGP
jgi:hypothetical protein